MQKRRFMLICAIMVFILLAALIGFGTTGDWQRGALVSSLGALTIVLMFFFAMLTVTNNWRADLSLCLVLAVLPAVGVVWGAGALFPFAVLVGGVVMTVGFVGCMSHGLFLEAAAATFMCVMGTLPILGVALFSKFEPNVLAAGALALLCILLYCVAVRESDQLPAIAMAAMIMIAAFPIGALLWSLELPELVAWVGGGITFLAGGVRAFQLGKRTMQVE